VRLFFALLPDAASAAQLKIVARTLTLSSPARAVPSEDFHLTLAFIGEVASSRLDELLKIGHALRALHGCVAIDTIEYWPASNVIVAAATKTPVALRNLAARLHEDLGLRPERELRAHVTLARKVVQAPVLPAMSAFVYQARSLKSDLFSNRHEALRVYSSGHLASTG
jgi:RNA 2',3'-cyclic 3'-phosphodiesterase